MTGKIIKSEAQDKTEEFLNEGNSFQQALKKQFRSRVADGLGALSALAGSQNAEAEKMKTDDKKFMTKRRLKNFELYQANKKDQTYMADQTNLAKFSYSLLIHNEPIEDSRSG